jgi:hypothetical protein
LYGTSSASASAAAAAVGGGASTEKTSLLQDGGRNDDDDNEVVVKMDNSAAVPPFTKDGEGVAATSVININQELQHAHLLGHTAIFGSHFDRVKHQWGYKCCGQVGEKNVDCLLRCVGSSTVL